MKVHFTLPAHYEAARVLFVLGRDGTGWRFYGLTSGGAKVVARNSRGHAIFGGSLFPTKREAVAQATYSGLNGYAIWNATEEGHDGGPLAYYIAIPRASQWGADGEKLTDDVDILGGL